MHIFQSWLRGTKIQLQFTSLEYQFHHFSWNEIVSNFFFILWLLQTRNRTFLSWMYSHGVTTKDGYQTLPSYSRSQQHCSMESFSWSFVISLRLTALRISWCVWGGWRDFSLVWGGSPSTDNQSTPQGSEMNLNVINEPTENFHIFLAEENPTLGNFYYFSPWLKLSYVDAFFLDIWINEPNVSSEFKMSLWHLKLFLWQLHGGTNWRLWLHCRIIQQGSWVEVNFLGIIMSVNSVAVKERAGLYTWGL